MSQPADTPAPPYYAVIFTSTRTDREDDTKDDQNDGYAQTASRMVELAQGMAGFLGIESARDGLGITVSYWESLEAIRAWRDHPEHAKARRRGREAWYKAFAIRICRVERAHGFDHSEAVKNSD
ncbi:MAG: antibiotic biosynthesis monooxygenase [Pseudodesulfovibrio sp.]|uniref:Antibiotic biosynthesis monooxygenase n=1 Tax=Pseudodesulfovibrio aespoeensis (strain ATCC 700646 / DSM 10631 / Aspo-2) TaxID=643562 RepID=E6VW41_PSEA9|nr:MULTISPECIES: antibiotic biosynthesis monooxygenase [Pseudodesulfovibrio]MBU4192633.1 antibiotic biosynthesis monooxygenase [Pseudomonadota bacterium]ADU63601.1 Antibiotic biosynthesis monooxygenase [Pseudodesulfovibrio aespoeensis Aspo-2]MBU4243216.1 antibiotic biosynthesis monooxygenase [Pseudomonadota bacterium]MBU4378919.1 antibiotic biosynthesis monooxygenase [Pseudomonadota bacterium]MBU4476726.1 antibiotic biosynthesis monooxygenase [Pseudomonadota bacterium]